MKYNNKSVNIIGAGLAGSEACLYLLKKGYNVNLYEMKPVKFSPAHKDEKFAELVCSNSFKSEDNTTASGILKNELSMLDSELLKIAYLSKVPSGASLSVDREKFSKLVTDKITSFNNVKVINSEVESIDLNLPTIIATGPLTSDKLSEFIKASFGDENLFFFDAIAPIVDSSTIDMNNAYLMNRYDKGDTKDFINCPLSKEEYTEFYNALITAETAKLKDFENNKVFEGCMPVEVMAKRGFDALRFGPMKPVGLRNPKDGITPFAVVQLRKENLESDSYNLVGFQTNLTYGAQKEVFRKIPALRHADFLRYGVMHRNTFICSPLIINKFFQSKKYENVFFAGQLSGVEGYLESVSSGLLSAINMDRHLNNLELIDFTNHTIIGALANYVASSLGVNFQPMGSNIGLLTPLTENIKDKKFKREKLYTISLNTIKDIVEIIK